MHRFTSRKFLLALIAQVVGIIALFYPEHTDAISEAATNFGALLVMALSAAGYIKGEAEVDARRVEGEHALSYQREQQRQASGEPQSRTRGASDLLNIAVAGLLGCCLLGGCATDPQTRWAQGREALTSATLLATQAVEAGKLSDRQILAVDAAIQSARRALEVAETQLPDGGQTFDSYMNIVSGVLDRLIETLSEHGPLLEHDNGHSGHHPGDHRGPASDRLDRQASRPGPCGRATDHRADSHDQGAGGAGGCCLGSGSRRGPGAFAGQSRGRGVRVRV